MIIVNPVNLAPLLADVESRLAAKMDALQTSQANNSATISQEITGVNDALAQITTINGEISTEVQAINQHTSEVVGDVSLKIDAKRAVKAIYRITKTGSGNVSIPAVVPENTVINLNTAVTASSAAMGSNNSGFGEVSTVGAKLMDANTVAVSGVVRCAVYNSSNARVEFESVNITQTFEVIEYFGVQ